MLPAAAAGVAAAVAVTPGPASVLSWWLAGLIIVTALAGPAGAGRVAAPHPPARPQAPRTHPAARRRIDRRAPLGGRRSRWSAPRSAAWSCSASRACPRRAAWTCSPARRRCSRRYRSPCWSCAAYPVVLRQLTRLAGRRRGVVLIVGFARGSAAAQAGVLPAFALVLAFAVVAFAAMARGAVAARRRGGVLAGRRGRRGGHRARGRARASPRRPSARSPRVPGVQRSATVSVATGNLRPGPAAAGRHRRPGQYAALTAATPRPPFPAARAGPAPPPAARRSPRCPRWSRRPGRDILGHAQPACTWRAGQLRLRVAGTPGQPSSGCTAGGQFAVVPRWALGRAGRRRRR